MKLNRIIIVFLFFISKIVAVLSLQSFCIRFAATHEHEIALHNNRFEYIPASLNNLIDEVSLQRRHPLSAAARLGNVDLVCRLLENGQQQSACKKAFHIAVCQGDRELVCRLLSVVAPGKEQERLLEVAANCGSFDTVREAAEQVPVLSREVCNVILKNAANRRDTTVIFQYLVTRYNIDDKTLQDFFHNAKLKNRAMVDLLWAHGVHCDVMLSAKSENGLLNMTMILLDIYFEFCRFLKIKRGRADFIQPYCA
jgi:hypothetical protein